MKAFARLLAVATGLALMLNGTPTWGQPTCASPGCNPTVSDANGNTAGGTNALINVDQIPGGATKNTALGFEALTSNLVGGNNNADGYQALTSNTTGNNNNANGSQALFANTTGNFNTASGAGTLFGNTTGNRNTGA